MVENSFKPDVVTCNILMHGLCSNGKEEALTLFDSWVSKGKKVDVISYNTLMRGLCKEGMIDAALELFANMKEKYNTILCALSESGRLEEAEKNVVNDG